MKNFLLPKRELELLNKGYDFIVGIDEVGRGAWAGPLLFCGYIFSRGQMIVKGMNDSKLISKSIRENLVKQVSDHSYKTKFLSSKNIDRMGLGGCLNSGLRELIIEFKIDLQGSKVLFVVDGYFKGEWDENIIFETKADGIYYSVAAASVIAKVIRDNLMLEMNLKYPGYAFDEHVGYGTKKHREALKRFGPCEIHRKSYKPIKLCQMKNSN